MNVSHTFAFSEPSCSAVFIKDAVFHLGLGIFSFRSLVSRVLTHLVLSLSQSTSLNLMIRYKAFINNITARYYFQKIKLRVGIIKNHKDNSLKSDCNITFGNIINNKHIFLVNISNQ